VNLARCTEREDWKVCRSWYMHGGKLCRFVDAGPFHIDHVVSRPCVAEPQGAPRPYECTKQNPCGNCAVCWD
jgi:hypothetical protein